MDGIFPWNYLPSWICEYFTTHFWIKSCSGIQNGRKVYLIKCVRCNYIRYLK